MKTRKKISIVIIMFFVISCGKKNNDIRSEFFPKFEIKSNFTPAKENVWVFILAGQSNMAGRGKVEPNDTIANQRILSINKRNELIIAKEPLHFYEPNMTGLDCGKSFAEELLKYIPDSVSLLIIPTAVGGTSINQWLNDSIFRGVRLLSNFKEKVEIGKKHGIIKAILWHQGENDATNIETIEFYDKNLKELFEIFRNETECKNLPIIVGELGSFSKNNENWQAINEKVRKYSKKDTLTLIVSTSDLKHKGDCIHFDSEGQRKLGKRFAEKFATLQK